MQRLVPDAEKLYAIPIFRRMKTIITVAKRNTDIEILHKLNICHANDKVCEIMEVHCTNGYK